MATEWPTGTVTFLFTDLEGSTRLWEEHADAMRPALARHDELLRTAIDSHGGQVVKTTGDGFFAVFADTDDAMAAALDAQDKLEAEPWPDAAPLRVRMGLHTGSADQYDGDYHGPSVNRAARVMAVAHGGQVICTRVTVDLIGDGLTATSLGQHRLRDLSAAQELFQVGDGDFPPLRSLDRVPTNLPTVGTDLIGRSADVDDLRALVGAERLVTLTGVGGVGKTRLALEVAAAATNQFPDGVWLVELAPANSTDEVLQAAAAAVGATVTDTSGLARYLAERHTLIVLDNCEHVLDDAADLADAILAAGAEPVILATSREPLALNRETVRGVRSLGVPPPDAFDADAAAAAAVRLFVDRASAATDSFSPTDDNLPAIADICRRLDGIPLAIELAAARVRAMPVDEIARRLDERFRLLSAGRGAQERHRTLQATVAWSHDLLTPEQQIVFRRLAVFPTSFDLEGAEAVAGDGGLDVIDALVRLVDQSLVDYDSTTGRYRLLETLRQYGTDRLAEADEVDLARDRHQAFYCSLVVAAADRDGFPTEAQVRRVVAELENLQAAVDWLGSQGRWTEVLLFVRGRFTLMAFVPTIAYRWYREALARDVELDPQDRIDAAGEFAYLARMVGEPETEWLATSIALADEAGLPHSPWADATLVVGAIHRDDDELAKAERLLATADERHDERAALLAMTLLANIVAAAGELERSDAIVDELLARARRCDSEVALYTPVIGAAGAYITSRQEPEFERGLEILDTIPLNYDAVTSQGMAERMWGLAHLGLGNPGRALPHLLGGLRGGERLPGLLLKDAALAVTVALYEAGEPTFAATVDGYAATQFPESTNRDLSLVWLTERKVAAEADIDPDELAKARATGAHLDRRGYLRLLAEIDALASQGASS